MTEYTKKDAFLRIDCLSDTLSICLHFPRLKQWHFLAIDASSHYPIIDRLTVDSREKVFVHSSEMLSRIINFLTDFNVNQHIYTYRGMFEEKAWLALIQHDDSFLKHPIKLGYHFQQLLKQASSPFQVIKNYSVDAYKDYLTLLNNQNNLEIETLDGRINHNDLSRILLQHGFNLDFPANPVNLAELMQKQVAILQGLQRLYESKHYQEVLQERTFLLKQYAFRYQGASNAIRADTTDAQLTEELLFPDSHIKDQQTISFQTPFGVDLLSELEHTKFANFVDYYRSFTRVLLPNKMLSKQFETLQHHRFMITAGRGGLHGFRTSTDPEVMDQGIKIHLLMYYPEIIDRYQILPSMIQPLYHSLLTNYYRESDKLKKHAYYRILQATQGAMDTPFDNQLVAHHRSHRVRLIGQILLLLLLDDLWTIGDILSVNTDTIYLTGNVHLVTQRVQQWYQKYHLPFEIQVIHKWRAKDSMNHLYVQENQVIVAGDTLNHYDYQAMAVTDMRLPAVVDRVWGEYLLQNNDFLTQPFQSDFVMQRLRWHWQHDPFLAWQVPLFGNQERGEYVIFVDRNQQIFANYQTVNRGYYILPSNHASWPLYLHQTTSDGDNRATQLAKKAKLPIGNYVFSTKSFAFPITLDNQSTGDLAAEQINLRAYHDLVKQFFDLWNFSITHHSKQLTLL